MKKKFAALLAVVTMFAAVPAYAAVPAQGAVQRGVFYQLSDQDNDGWYCGRGRGGQGRGYGPGCGRHDGSCWRDGQQQ